MNWVLVLVLLTLAGCIVSGYHRGLLRMVYSFVSWIIVLFAVAWAAPYIDNYLVENTSIYDRIVAQCEDAIRQSVDERTEATVAAKEDELGALGMNVPDAVLAGILEQTADAASGFMEESGIYTQMAAGLADFVVKGMAILVVLVFSRLFLQILFQIFGIVSHIPVLKGLNRTLGLFAGGIYGLLIIWIAFYVIALFSASETGGALISYIYENSFLTFLYQNNMVLLLILCFL